MPFLIAVLPFIIELFVASPSPIIRRHDRDDNRYIALGSRYAPAICKVGGATGTLIGDRWVITAAHVTRNISPFSRSVVCGTEHRAIKATYAVSQMSLAQISAKVAAADDDIADLALVELASPVATTLHVELNRDTTERGQKIVVVGVGLSGTGETGPTDEDGKLRAATNVIDGAEGQYIDFSFSPPGDSSATDLEGIGGPGDSGGPAFIEKNGQLYIAGVSSINSKRDATGTARYRSVEIYSRIATNTSWIEAALRHEIKPDSVAETISDVRRSWPDTHGARLVKSFIDAFNSGDSVTLVKFEQAYRADSLLATRPAAARTATWRRLLNGDWGSLRPAAYTQVENTVMVLVDSPKQKMWMRIEFWLDPAGKIVRMRTASPEDPYTGS